MATGLPTCFCQQITLSTLSSPPCSTRHMFGASMSDLLPLNDGTATSASIEAESSVLNLGKSEGIMLRHDDHTSYRETILLRDESTSDLASNVIAPQCVTTVGTCTAVHLPHTRAVPAVCLTCTGSCASRNVALRLMMSAKTPYASLMFATLFDMYSMMTSYLEALITCNKRSSPGNVFINTVCLYQHCFFRCQYAAGSPPNTIIHC